MEIGILMLIQSARLIGLGNHVRLGIVETWTETASTHDYSQSLHIKRSLSLYKLRL